MTISFHCQRDEINRERQGYFNALSKHHNVVLNGGVDQHSDMPALTGQLENPICLLFPDPPKSLLPHNLVRSSFPTVCFQIDTYSKPEWRARWSALFDYVILFHPGFESYFSQYEHKRVLVLPHAVDADAYSNNVEDRIYEVGWVGRIDGPLYEMRRQLLPELSRRYKLNDWQRVYKESETPYLYSLSRIVVNVGRDDYPQDANLRCFEAMAAGSLLITRLPSELEQIGFRAGEHFIGYRNPEDLPFIIDTLLRDAHRCRDVACKARELVLREHTYDARTTALLAILSKDAGRKFAPARQWPQHRIDYVYLHYFCKHLKYEEAKQEFGKLFNNSPALALRGVPLLLRCWQHSLKAEGKRASINVI